MNSRGGGSQMLNVGKVNEEIQIAQKRIDELLGKWGCAVVDLCKFKEIDDTSFLAKNLCNKITGAVTYTEEEQEQIINDAAQLWSIKSKHLTTPVVDAAQYISTAGAPGSGKTTHIERYKIEQGLDNFIYVDPDQGYLQELTGYKKDTGAIGAVAAYTKWRDASNFIANLFLYHGIIKGYNIIHGTTATSPRVIHLYDKLKEHKYKIHIRLLFAPAHCRIAAIEHREKKIGAANVTPEDMIGKVNPVFERINDAYVKYANSMVVIFNTGEFWLGQGQQKIITYDILDTAEMQKQCLDDIITEIKASFPSEETEQHIKFMKVKGLITADDIRNSNDCANIKHVFT